jgi:hypothetical protein
MVAKVKSKKLPVCSICQKPFAEYGNNAQPVNNGRCCNECNWHVVIPARLTNMGKGGDA